MNLRLLSIAAVLTFSTTLFSGCGGGPSLPQTFPVQGQVTLDGKPMESGEIAFVSVAEGIRDTLPVTNGAFNGNVLAGDRKVEIRSYRTETANTEMYGADAPETTVNFIPPKYNEQSSLNATISESGANSFQFEVTSR